MKVALVHLRQSRTGGTERYLNQMAAYLCERGDEVTIVCRSYEEPPHPAVRFERLRSPVPGATWRMWAFARSVERHVRGSRYDVVYGLGKAWTHDVIRLGGGCHQTYLDTAHEHHAKSRWHAPFGGWLKNRAALAIEQRALTAGAYRFVIVNSEMVKRDVMARYAVPEERVRVVYNGVDLGRFDRARRAHDRTILRQSFGISDDAFLALFLGTGYGRKGLKEFLDAFASVAREVPGARALVIGADSALPLYRKRVGDLGLHDSVLLLGERVDPERFYAASDLYVLPTHYDPFANSTLEALASGLPVITTDANGGAEVLNDRCGAVVATGDGFTERLTQVMRSWTDRDRVEAARAEARAVAERHPQSRTAAESAAVLDAAAAERTQI